MTNERRDVPLSRPQIENWRRCCLSHWVSGLTHKESIRQANELCDMALASLATPSEPSTPSRDAVLEEAAKVCDTKAAQSSVEMFGVAMRLAAVAIRQRTEDKPPRQPLPNDVDLALQEYLLDYEFCGDEGSYTPNKQESMLIEDCIQGLLVDDDFIAAFTAQQSLRPPGALMFPKLAAQLEKERAEGETRQCPQCGTVF